MSNVFEGALEELDQRGWTQGIMENDLGQVCITGAVRLALMGASFLPAPLDSGYKEYLSIMRFLSDRIEFRVLPRSWGEAMVVPWNDAEARTEEDVKLLLKQAAADWDEKNE